MSGTVGFAHFGFKQLFPLPSIVLYCSGMHISLCTSEINDTKPFSKHWCVEITKEDGMGGVHSSID